MSLHTGAFLAADDRGVLVQSPVLFWLQKKLWEPLLYKLSAEENDLILSINTGEESKN